MAMQQQEPYPVRFTVDYPDRPLDRLSTGFRICMAIPILIVLGTVSGGNGWDWSSNGSTRTAAVGAGGLLFFLEIAALVVVIVAWFAILFTGRYPPFRLAQ
jgi:hypothetical protein